VGLARGAKLAKKLDWVCVRTWHAKYASGEVRVEDMAKEFGVTPETVRALFKRHGLSTRVHARYTYIGKEKIHALHARYMKGEKVGDLAAEAPCSTQNLLLLFKREGLETFKIGAHPNSRRDGSKILNAFQKANAVKRTERYTGDSQRKGDWAPRTDPHAHVTVDGECLLCGRMQA